MVETKKTRTARVRTVLVFVWVCGKTADFMKKCK